MTTRKKIAPAPQGWLASRASKISLITGLILSIGGVLALITGAWNAVIESPNALASKWYVLNIWDKPSPATIRLELDIARGKHERAEAELATWELELAKARATRQARVEQLVSDNIRKTKWTIDLLEEQIATLKAMAKK